jgi:Fe-S oxidoreductase
MCPSYRATKDEQDTTRARANALRLALTDENPPKNRHGPIGQRWIMEVMDLCLSCKACKSECPSNVDVAKLKAEFLQAYYARRARPLGHLLVKHVHRLSPLAARFARLNNWFVRRKWVRGAFEGLAGIDRRRSLPEWHRDHFRRWFYQRGARSAERGTESHEPAPPSSTPSSALRAPRSIILLDDCFTTYQEPQIGRAAVTLLERAGFRVELAGVCCGRAMMSKGFLTDARKLARDGIAKLDHFASAGVPILGLEPSCILALSDEWPELVPEPAAKRVAAVAEMAEQWLARQVSDNALSLDVSPLAGKALLHPHCHQKALVGLKGTADALKLVRGLDVTVLDAGCCGMAGAFGYEKRHYDISVKIANLELIPALNANPSATIIATGTSCRHQIRDLTGRVALHPLEVLAGEAGSTRVAYD